MPQQNSLDPSIKKTPPHGNLPIIEHLLSSYKFWHECLLTLPKTSRYTLGETIDGLLLATIEAVFSATYGTKERKLVFIQVASAKLDVAKFFFRLAWEIKSLDNKKYIAISEKLGEIGKMLGGWQRQLLKV